jgi:hypothetical protein
MMAFSTAYISGKLIGGLMKSFFCTIAVSLLVVSAAHANPFLDLYKRDSFTQNSAEYGIDGIVFRIDVIDGDNEKALKNFEYKCLNTIPVLQMDLLKKLKAVHTDIDVNHFTYKTHMVKTQGQVINGVQLPDYMCRMNITIHPASKYKIAPEYSALFEGKKSEDLCKALVQKSKNNQIKIGLLTVNYNVQYKPKSFGGYKPEFGQVRAIKIMPKSQTPTTLD